MTLVQNHLQPSNGSKILYFIAGFFLVWFSSCSPKVQPVSNESRFPIQEEVSFNKSRYKYTKGEQASYNLFLFLSLGLDNFNYNNFTYDQAWDAGTPMSFYQGFKMALNSYAEKNNRKFNLYVYDLKNIHQESFNGIIDYKSKHSSVFVGASISISDLEKMTLYAKEKDIPVAFPLSSPSPQKMQYANSVRIQGTIDIHTQNIVKQIKEQGYAKKVYLLNPDTTDNVQFTESFKKHLGGLLYKTITSTAQIDKYLLSETMTNVVICATAYKHEVDSINKQLSAIAQEKNTAITVFGRPELLKLNLTPEYLQNIDEKITISYKVFHKDMATRFFATRYIATYNMEPNEYAFKGFDFGCYIMTLIIKHGDKWMNYITKTPYSGLRQEYKMVKDSDVGYYNENVYPLKYNGKRFEQEIK